MQFPCIKCGTQYEEKDAEAYLCEPCLKERKVIAKKIDKQMGSRVSKRKTMSALAAYDASPKVHGFVITKL